MIGLLLPLAACLGSGNPAGVALPPAGGSGSSPPGAPPAAPSLPAPPRPLPDGAVFPYPAHEASLIGRIEPACLGPLAGTFKRDGEAAAIVLTAPQGGGCILVPAAAAAIRQPDGSLLRGDAATGGSSAYRVVQALRRHVFLIRVDVNLGGSATLRRYLLVRLLVSSGAGRRSRGGADRTILLVDATLPAGLRSDGDAAAAARRSQGAPGR